MKYIAVDKLVEVSLLDSKDLHHFNVYVGIIEYYAVRVHKNQYLKKAFGNFNKSQNSKLKSAYQKFITQNDWVKNCAIFKAFRKTNDNQACNFWPQDYKSWIKERTIGFEQFQEEIDYQIFLQFIFYK